MYTRGDDIIDCRNNKEDKELQNSEEGLTKVGSNSELGSLRGNVSSGFKRLDSSSEVCSIAASRFSDFTEESSDETVVDWTEERWDRSELSEASELALVMSIILGVLTWLISEIEGNGKAVDLLGLNLVEVVGTDMVVGIAETTQDLKENFDPADSKLVVLDEARV